MIYSLDAYLSVQLIYVQNSSKDISVLVFSFDRTDCSNNFYRSRSEQLFNAAMRRGLRMQFAVGRTLCHNSLRQQSMRALFTTSGIWCCHLQEKTVSDLKRVATQARQEAIANLEDLKDIASTARAAANALANARQRHASDIPDGKVKQKLTTLNASLKTYSYRLTNLETEVQSIIEDAEAVLASLNNAAAGTETVQQATHSKNTNDDDKMKDDDFVLDSDFSASSPQQKPTIQTPPTAEEHLKQHPAGAGTFAEVASSASSSNIESDDGDLKIEYVSSDERAKFNNSEDPGTIEIELPDAVDEKPVSEITDELFTKNIDFSDCRDAKQLRNRYRDFLNGKLSPPQAKPQRATQPPPPPRDTYTPPPNNYTEKGMQADPYPNAQRKMVDPNRLVGDLKLEMAREHKISPYTIGMFVAGIRMDENKRISDYPQVQHNQIELRTV